MAKAYCTVTVRGGTPTLQSNSYTISSITNNGVGDYTVNFTTNFGNANYACGGCVEVAGNDRGFTVDSTTAPAAGSVRVGTTNQSGSRSDESFHFWALGDQ